MSDKTDLPLYPGSKLAARYARGWLAWRSDRMAKLPPGQYEDPFACGQLCPHDWGSMLVCTDHGDGYHAAAVNSAFGPRIVAVWMVSDE